MMNRAISTPFFDLTEPFTCEVIYATTAGQSVSSLIKVVVRRLSGGPPPPYGEDCRGATVMSMLMCNLNKPDQALGTFWQEPEPEP